MVAFTRTVIITSPTSDADIVSNTWTWRGTAAAPTELFRGQTGNIRDVVVGSAEQSITLDREIEANGVQIEIVAPVVGRGNFMIGFTIGSRLASSEGEYRYQLDWVSSLSQFPPLGWPSVAVNARVDDAMRLVIAGRQTLMYVGDKAPEAIFIGERKVMKMYRGTTLVYEDTSLEDPLIDVNTAIAQLAVTVGADDLGRPNVFLYTISWRVFGNTFTPNRYQIQFSENGTTWPPDNDSPPVFTDHSPHEVHLAGNMAHVRVRAETHDGSTFSAWATESPPY